MKKNVEEKQPSQKRISFSSLSEFSVNDIKSVDFQGPNIASGQVDQLEISDQISILVPSLKSGIQQRVRSPSSSSDECIFVQSQLYQEQQGLKNSQTKEAMKMSQNMKKSQRQLRQEFQQSGGVLFRRGNKTQSILGTKILEGVKFKRKEEENLIASIDKREDAELLEGQRQRLFPIGEEENASALDTIRRFSGKSLLRLILACKYANILVENLKQKTYSKKPHQLTHFQNILVDDLQYDPKRKQKLEKYGKDKDGYKKRFLAKIKMFKRIKNSQTYEQLSKCLTSINLFIIFIMAKINQAFDHIPLIEPTSFFVIIWNTINILMILIIYFLKPFAISFEIPLNSPLFGKFDLYDLFVVFLIIMGLDIIVNLNIAFIRKGQIIKSRTEIFTHYFKGKAIVDIICFLNILFGLQNLVQIDDLYLQLFGNIVSLIIFYALSRSKIQRMIYQTQEYFLFSDFHLDLFGLVELIFTVVLICHIFACMWHGVAHYSPYQQTWLVERGIKNADNATKYNSSYYWAAMTMITVGYGDIVPQNNLEMLVCNFTMFLACGVFAFSINSIGLMLQNLQSRKVEYKKCVSTLKEFLTRNQVKFQLQTRIRNYFDYSWQEEMEQNDEEINYVLSKLSSQLQEELKYELRVRLLKQSNALNHFNDTVLKEISYIMEEIKFSPGEQIILQGVSDDAALYIIAKGKVEIQFKDQRDGQTVTNQRNFHMMQKGDSFGEYSFFTGMQRTASAVSKEFSRLFKIKRESMLTILQQNANDRETFFKIKDDILFVGSFKDLNMRCFGCLKNTHLIKDCPTVHYYPCKERILKKYLYPIYQERSEYDRNVGPYNYFAPLLEMKYLEQQVKDINDNQEDFNINEETYNEDFEEIDDNIIRNNTKFRSQSVRSKSTIKGSYHYPQVVDQKESQNNSSESVLSMEEVDRSPNYQRRSNNQYPTVASVQTAGFGFLQNDNTDINPLMGETTFELKNDANQFQRSQEKQASRKLNRREIDPSQRKVQPRYNQLSMIPSNNNVENQQESSSNNVVGPHQHRLSTFQKSNDNTPSYLSVETHQRQSIQRVQTKTKSQARSNTIKTDNRADLSPHGQVIDLTIYGVEMENFDKNRNYIYYFPNYNPLIVMKKLNSLLKMFFNKRLAIPTYSLYSFYFIPIKKAYKMRKLVEIKDKPEDKADHTTSKFRSMQTKKLFKIKSSFKSSSRFKKKVQEDE